jgi:hypothetical protein
MAYDTTSWRTAIRDQSPIGEHLRGWKTICLSMKRCIIIEITSRIVIYAQHRID